MSLTCVPRQRRAIGAGLLGELIRKRAGDLLSSPQALANTGPDFSEKEWPAELAAIQAAVESALGKR